MGFVVFLRYKKLFDSIVLQNTENYIVAKSLSLFLKYSAKCLFLESLYQTVENLKYKKKHLAINVKYKQGC